MAMIDRVRLLGEMELNELEQLEIAIVRGGNELEKAKQKLLDSLKDKKSKERLLGMTDPVGQTIFHFAVQNFPDLLPSELYHQLSLICTSPDQEQSGREQEGQLWCQPTGACSTCRK